MFRLTLAAALVTTMTCAAAESGMETTIRLKIPTQTSADAASRGRGHATAAAPILILEDVELGDAESVRIDVLGPADAKSRKRPFLGSAAMVGVGPPRQTLVIPLNDAGSRLVAGRKEVTLMLRLTNGRRLKYKRAYFDPN